MTSAFRLSAMTVRFGTWTTPVVLSLIVHAGLIGAIFGLAGPAELPRPAAVVPVELVFETTAEGKRSEAGRAAVSAVASSDRPPREEPAEAAKPPPPPVAPAPVKPVTKVPAPAAVKNPDVEPASSRAGPERSVMPLPEVRKTEDRPPVSRPPTPDAADAPMPVEAAPARAKATATAKAIPLPRRKPPPPPRIKPLPDPRATASLAATAERKRAAYGEVSQTPLTAPAGRTAAMPAAVKSLAIAARTGSGETRAPRPTVPMANRPPPYPWLARRKGWQGRVVLRVRVAATGSPLSVAVRTSSGRRVLDEAARKAVKSWTFDPARLAGVPVIATIDVPIVFRLD